MTFLLVMGILLGIGMLLLFSSVRLRLAYRDGAVSASLHYLLFRFDLSPDALAAKQAKRERRKAKAKPKKKKPPKAKKAGKKKLGFKDLRPLIRPLLRASGKAVRLVCRHLVFYRVRITGEIAGEDAHQTALLYAKICTALSLSTSILDELFVLKKPRMHVSPCFTKDKSQWDISLRVRIRPAYLLAAGAGVLYTLAKLLLRPKPNAKMKHKGGQFHESAASHQ